MPYTRLLLLALTLASCAGQGTDDPNTGTAEPTVSRQSADTAPQPSESVDTASTADAPRSPAEPAAGPAASEPTSCTSEVGVSAANRLVQQCLDVSPATHPPCNAANGCDLIRDEIARGCALLDDAAANEAGCAASEAD